MRRHEIKYMLNQNQFEILKNNLSTILKVDTNSKNKDGYFIRSLYFDDYNNTNLMQVVDGISKREKYRIRYYDFDKSYITLEKKDKENSLGFKQNAKLTEKDCYKFLNNENLNIKNNLVLELESKIKSQLYKPCIIIDYQRLAFTYPINNVRITLDYNLSCSDDINNFFKKNINSIPLLENCYAILEIKYDNFLPDFIRYMLDYNNLFECSFSKYATGRIMLEKIKGSDKI